MGPNCQGLQATREILEEIKLNVEDGASGIENCILLFGYIEYFVSRIFL